MNEAFTCDKYRSSKKEDGRKAPTGQSLRFGSRRLLPRGRKVRYSSTLSDIIFDTGVHVNTRSLIYEQQHAWEIAEKRVVQVEAEKRVAQVEAEAEKRVAQVEAEKRVTQAEAEAEKRVAQVEAEKRVTQVEAEAVERVAQVEAEAVKRVAQVEVEKLNVLRDLDSTTTSLEKAQSRLNSMTPRALMEYVEFWVMPNDTTKLSREERWQHFFAKTEAGKELSECLLRQNKQWKKSSLAKRIVGLYQHISDSIHEQSHDIHTSQKVVLEKLGLTAQAYNAASCMVIVLDLKIASAYHNAQNDKLD